MNNNNDNKRKIRDSQENENRTVTIMHKASATSLNTLQVLLGNEGYEQDKVKLLKIESSLIAKLFAEDGNMKDADELRKISGLESELLILYADEDLDLSVDQLEDLSEALEILHQDHTNILAIGHLFLGGEANGLPALMDKDTNDVGTVKNQLGYNEYTPHTEELLHQNFAGWLSDDEQKISFIKKNDADEAVTYGDEFGDNASLPNGTDLHNEIMPLYRNPGSASQGITVQVRTANSVPIVMSNTRADNKPSQVYVNMDVDQPDDLLYIIGKAMSFAGSLEGCTDPKAIHYNAAATINVDPCVQLRSEITSDKAILTNEDSLIDVKLSLNNDKINKNDIDLQGERQISLEINSTEHVFSAHDDTNHEDHGIDTKGKLGNFEYELAEGEIEIILEDGEYDETIDTHKAPITDTNDEKYTDDTNDENYEKYNNGWEEFKYNLIIHDLSTIESDSNSSDYHDGAHNKYYVNVPLRLTDSLEALTAQLKINGQIRKINKDGSHELNHTVSLNNALELYGSEIIRLGYHVHHEDDGDAGNHTFTQFTSFNRVSDKLKAITMEGGDLTFTYEVNFEESNIADDETGDELVIELRVDDETGAEINLDSGEDHKEFELRLAIADCTDPDANNYDSNVDKQQLIDDNKLGDTMCTYSGCHNTNAENYAESSFINADGVVKDKSNKGHLIEILDDLCHIEVCEDTNASNYDVDAAGIFIRKANNDLCQYRKNIELSVERNNNLTNELDDEGNIKTDYKNLSLYGTYTHYINLDQGVKVNVKYDKLATEDKVTLILNGQEIDVLKEADDSTTAIDYSIIVDLQAGNHAISLVIENEDDSIATQIDTIVVQSTHLRCPQDTGLPSSLYNVFAYHEDAANSTASVNTALTDNRVSPLHYPEFYEILQAHADSPAGQAGEVICEINGCMDTNYEDYDAQATRQPDDALCTTKTVTGCTVEEAYNFDEDAHVDDGSCKVIGCVDSRAFRACNYIDQNHAKFANKVIDWEHDGKVCEFISAKPEESEYTLDLGDEEKQQNPEFRVNFINTLGERPNDFVDEYIIKSGDSNPLELGLTQADLADTKWSLDGNIIQLKAQSKRFRSVSMLSHIPSHMNITSWSFHEEPKYFQYKTNAGALMASPYNLEFTTDNIVIKYVAYLKTAHEVGLSGDAINVDRMTKLDLTNATSTEKLTFVRHYDLKKDSEGNLIYDENNQTIQLDKDDQPLPEDYLDTAKCDINTISIRNAADGSAAPANVLILEQDGEKLYTNVMTKLGGYHFNPDALSYGDNEFKLRLNNLSGDFFDYVVGSEFTVHKVYTACTDQEGGATNYDSTAIATGDNSLCEYDNCDVEGDGTWLSHAYDSNCGNGKNCIPIHGCKLEVCTDEGADEYVTLDESLHIENNSLCRYTRCTDSNATNYDLIESAPTGHTILSGVTEASLDSDKAIAEKAQLKLFNVVPAWDFEGAVMITKPDESIIKLSTDNSADTQLRFNDIRLNGFPEGQPEQADFKKADGVTDDVEAYDTALEEYQEKLGNQEIASTDYTLIDSNNINLQLHDWGTYKIQYIISSRNSRIKHGADTIAPNQNITFAGYDTFARGILELEVKDENKDGYVLDGSLIADNENLCTGIDPCDGEDKLYKDYIKLDACEVCILDEDQHILAIDENGLCDDTNGRLHGDCPDGQQLDDCGDCRDDPVVNEEGETVPPEDWNETCNDCAGNPSGNHLLTACGDCTTDTTLDLDPETKYCNDTNSPNYGECPEGHLDDCGTCHENALQKNAETGEITSTPAGWNAECSICNDTAAENYKELGAGEVIDNENKCEFITCNDNTAMNVMNFGHTNSVKDESFVAAYGSNITANASACVYEGCSNQLATNYSGTDNELNTTRAIGCVFEYCDNTNACNYMTKDEKQYQVGSELGQFNSGGCIIPSAFEISTTSYIKENNVSYPVSLPEDNVIGHKKVEIEIEGNLLQSKRTDLADMIADVANPTNENLTVFLPLSGAFKEKFDGLSENNVSVDFKINFTDRDLMIPIHIDEESDEVNDPVDYKSSALIALELAKEEQNTATDAADTAQKVAKAAEDAKQAQITAATNELGDSNDYNEATLWGAYNRADQAHITAVNNNSNQGLIDSLLAEKDAALAAKNDAVTALAQLNNELGDLTTARSDADTALTNAESALAQAESAVTTEEVAIRDSIADGRVPVPVTMTWHRDQEDELLVGEKSINTYNLEIELTNESDQKYFGVSHVLMSVQDNNFNSHLGEVRNEEGKVATTNMTGFSATNARLAKGMSFGDCKVDAIKLNLTSGSLNKKITLLKNSPYELDLENDAELRQLNYEDEITITATALSWQNYAAVEVLYTEKTVTLHKLGCTNTNFNTYHESNTMPFTYTVTSLINGQNEIETVSSCRNSGCLDEFAYTFDGTADHADLSMCEYSVTNNINDEDKCNYDSNATLLTDNTVTPAVSEYAKYMFYCEDESSALCQLWLGSDTDMLPAQDKELVTLSENADGEFAEELKEGGKTYMMVSVEISNDYLAYITKPEYDLEETADLLALEEKYREYMLAHRKENKLNAIINNSVNKAGNDVAEIIDHKATVGRALASMLEAAEAEDDAAKVVFDELETEFLAKYTDVELETYDSNITTQSVQTYLEAKLARHISERIVDISCDGPAPKLLISSDTTNNQKGGTLDLSKVENMPNGTGEIEINLENADSVVGNVLKFKVGELPNPINGAYNSQIMTEDEYDQAKSSQGSDGLERSSGEDRSSKNNGLEFGVATCNDTNADNYDEDALNAVNEDGNNIARPTVSACEYYFCDDTTADNTNEFKYGSLAQDGTEGSNVPNDNACAYYYCSKLDACNYYDGKKDVLYNNEGLAISASESQKALAVESTQQNICFVPTIEMTDKFETSKFYKAENAANVLRGSISQVVKGHFSSNLLSTQLNQGVFENQQFEIEYAGDSDSYTMYLSDTPGLSIIQIPQPGPTGTTKTNIFGSWSFTKKAQQLELSTTEKFGYNIEIVQQVSFGFDPIRLFLRVTNTKEHLFRGKLLIPNQNPVNLEGSFASDDSQSRKRISKIFNHEACDEVVSLALKKGDEVIDRIFGDSEEFNLPQSIRDSDEPVTLEIVGQNANDLDIHTSGEFEILFLRTECGDSNAINYYEGINNDPDNSQCEELACLDSNACNYENDPAPTSGGKWIHDESLCNVGDNDGDCCPELNECGACGELQTAVDTGLCEHGDRNGECPEGMVKDRCGNCFASETDEGFDECVGCTNPDDHYFDSNKIEHDESMCAVCGDVEACNYDSNAKADLSNVHDELCEYNTIKNIEVLPSLDNHMESKGYTKYDLFEVVFDSNIFLNPFTNEHVAGEWTIGDMKLKLSEGESKWTQSGEEYHVGDLVDKEDNDKKIGSWRLHSTEQTLTNKQVSGAEWIRLENNTDEKAYNLEIQTSDKTIYYINMEPFFSNPISKWNVIEDGQLGQLEHTFMRKDAKAEDNGDSCITTGVDYKLLRRATQKEIDDNELEEEWIESASGTVTENRIQTASNAPGLHMLKLKPNCPTCDGNLWEESDEFTLMGEICSIEKAENYEEDIFKTAGVDKAFAVPSMQNDLEPSGNKDAEGNDYMVPESEGACEYMGCNSNALACNYSEHFEISGPCLLPLYGKTCAGGCVVKLDENGQPLLDANGNEQPNKDECGECHPLDVKSNDTRWNESCADCAGIPYGTHAVDLCGDCVLKGTEEFNAACTDCAGVENGDSYLVYTDAKEGDAKFICTKTEKVCGDSNACNYDAAEDVNPLALAINDDVCTYPQGYPDRVTADCDNNCLEGYTADCRGICGLETDETFLVKDSCGWCGGSSQNCSPLNLEEGHRWQVASSCDKNSSIYDPHKLILSMYKINNDSDKERYQLLWESKSEDDESISEEELEPKTMLWIEIKDGSTQDKLDEIHFMNLTAIQQLAKDSRVRLGHLGVREAEVQHVLSKATNILDGSSIRGYADELNVELVADEEKQTVLAEIQINKRETDAEGLVINNGEIDHFWMNIDGTCTVRLFHADMNNAGTVVQLVGPNGLTPIESRDDAVEIVVGDNETDQDVWVKVQIQNRIDDGSNFTDLITDSNDGEFDEDRFNAEMEATKTSYETVIVAIERPGTKFTGADSKVNITYSLDGPEGINA